MKGYFFKILAPGDEIHLISIYALDIRSAINFLYQKLDNLDFSWDDLRLFRTYYVVNLASQRRSTRRLDYQYLSKLQTVVKEFIND